VDSLKRCISAFEKIDDHEHTRLFLTPSSQTDMDKDSKITIRHRTGPGFTSQEPLALVSNLSGWEGDSLGESGQVPDPFEHGGPSPETRYLYYRLYNANCEMPSKASFITEEPSLGRIRADFVAPPHTPASIKWCISRVEKNADLSAGNLFADLYCDSPIPDGHISISTGRCPGMSPEEPMALVQADKGEVFLQKLYSRKIRATRTFDFSDIPGWLSLKVGEIYGTDGKVVQKTGGDGVIKYDGYIARSSTGETGFIYKGYVEFI